jgi:prophage regulatory protein
MPSKITLLDEREVVRRTSLSRRTLWRYVANEFFPAPVPIGTRRVAWIETEVQTWLADRITERKPRRVQRSGAPRGHCRGFNPSQNGRSRPRHRESQTARPGRPRKYDLLAIATYVAQQKLENPKKNSTWAHQSAVIRFGCKISTVFRALREHPDAVVEIGD